MKKEIKETEKKIAEQGYGDGRVETDGPQGRGTRSLQVGNSQICVGEGNLESVVKGSERFETLWGRMG